MHPILPFAAGLAAGALLVRLVKSDQTRSGLERAGQSVRRATTSSLKSIEGASARARDYLEAPDTAQPEPAHPHSADNAHEVGHGDGQDSAHGTSHTTGHSDGPDTAESSPSSQPPANKGGSSRRKSSS
ncbi:hypothetical protein CKO15_10110 [Halorhodospira abdelmalekii]|uniref:hypothetical protein n=1 Tax=Halorhodospira abdelmalekii TaxID=421629 RepID=UPI0019065B31|nr:hypothetical protein [Halorhodospira abdelmalekii]MBK1735632.1 hypothetical protein [Halorhodospira abdelmalekii]